MASTSPARIDDELFASAKAVGSLMSRSAAQQIAHWARIGRELEAGVSVSVADIGQVLAGELSYDDLTSEEQALVRATWAERLVDRLSSLNLAADFRQEGRTYVELDAAGHVVQRKPSTRGPRRTA
ncbi:MAG: hypothetical protein JWM40_1110 [Frankiales bacterium]|nr:hypothetical protein [Frankiales bacterium]